MDRPEIEHWALHYVDMIRRPDYLGALDSGRQVATLVDFALRVQAAERTAAAELIAAAEYTTAEARAALRTKKKEIRAAKKVLSRPEFEPVIFRQSKQSRAALRVLGLKTQKTVQRYGFEGKKNNKDVHDGS